MGDMFAVGGCDCNCNSTGCSNAICAILAAGFCGVCRENPLVLTFNSGSGYGPISMPWNGLSARTSGWTPGGVATTFEVTFSEQAGTLTSNTTSATDYGTVVRTDNVACGAAFFHFNFSGALVLSALGYLNTLGITDIYVNGVSGYSPYTPSCYPTFNVYGCHSQLLAGASIGIWNSSAKTTSYGTGTTNYSGEVTIAISVLSASFYYEISASRFVTKSGTQDGFNPADSIAATMNPASGYICLTTGTCSFPLPTTLYCTFANASFQTFTYSSGTWTASFTYLTVAYVLSLTPAGTMTATAGGTGFTATFALGACPVVPGFSGTITVPGSGTGSAIGNGAITE